MTYDPKIYWENRGKDYKVSVDTTLELKNLSDLVKQYSKAGDFFLEIGSGYGRVFKFLVDDDALLNRCYLMCDISETMIAECKKRTGIAPKLWDGENLTYKKDAIDFIISFSVLLHVPPDKIFDHMKEMVRVAQKYIYIATYVGSDEGLAEHCFSHDYFLYFHVFNLKIIDEQWFMDGKRINWLLEKK